MERDPSPDADAPQEFDPPARPAIDDDDDVLAPPVQPRRDSDFAPGASPPLLAPASPPVEPGAMGVYAPYGRVRRLQPIDITSEERTMAMLCHLLAIFTGFIAPLIIWLIKRKESRFVDAHGRESLNLNITLLLFMMLTAGAAFCGVLLPIVGLIAICGIYLAWFAFGIYALVVLIIHAVAAGNGEYRRIAMAIPFFGRIDPFE